MRRQEFAHLNKLKIANVSDDLRVRLLHLNDVAFGVFAVRSCQHMMVGVQKTHLIKRIVANAN